MAEHYGAGGADGGGRRAPERRRSDPARSMSLLADLAQTALDPGYADTARRRAEVARRRAVAARRAGRPGPAPERGRRGRRVLGALLTLAVVGGVLAAAAGQARRQAPEVARLHAALITEIHRDTAQLDTLAAQERTLAAGIQQAQQQALRSSTAGATAAARLQRLRTVTGAEPLTGPGVAVVLNDGPTSPAALTGATAGTASAGTVRDRDLQQVVNALWAAGAEAVAVGGQRLTGLSSIRAAGDAILVDFRPVTPPYRVVALGDPDTLLSTFRRSPTYATFRTYAETYGMGFSVSQVDHATVPAAPDLRLHVAVLAGADSPGADAARPTLSPPSASPPSPPSGSPAPPSAQPTTPSPEGSPP